MVQGNTGISSGSIWSAVAGGTTHPEHVGQNHVFTEVTAVSQTVSGS